MGEDVYVGTLDRGAIRARGNRLNWGLAVDHDQTGAEAPCSSRQRADLRGRDVSELHARDEGHPEPRRTFVTKALHLSNELVQVGGVCVICDGKCPIAQCRDAPQHLTGKESAVAKEGVAVQIHAGVLVHDAPSLGQKVRSVKCEERSGSPPEG
jgi:hypothetical protein